MNLKNIDWKHVALIAITLAVVVDRTLVADGVAIPEKVAEIVAALASILNWLNGSPVATQAQIVAKTTRMDMRRLARAQKPNREDKTR